MVKKRVLKKTSQTKNKNRGIEDMTIDTPITAK